MFVFAGRPSPIPIHETRNTGLRPCFRILEPGRRILERQRMMGMTEENMASVVHHPRRVKCLRYFLLLLFEGFWGPLAQSLNLE